MDIRIERVRRRPRGTLFRIVLTGCILMFVVRCGGEIDWPENPPRTIHTALQPISIAEADALQSPLSRCELLEAQLASVAGPELVPCSPFPKRAEAFDCANAAFRARKPFTLCHGTSVMSCPSRIENGVAGNADGDLFFFYSNGPGYRGRCARENVLLSATGWPKCATELSGKVDTETGEAFREPGSARASWPIECRARALRAPREPFVRPIGHVRPDDDRSRWKIPCTHAVEDVELLIDQEGYVVCVSVADDLEPAGLSEKLRQNLMNVRFEPPEIYGTRIEARYHLSVLGCSASQLEQPF